MRDGGLGEESSVSIFDRVLTQLKGSPTDLFCIFSGATPPPQPVLPFGVSKYHTTPCEHTSWLLLVT